jgi:DNA-binding NtrC family response regulator
VPPLRERREDIPALARHLVGQAAQLADRPAPRLPDDVVRRLVIHDWPGNVRELENTLMRAVVLCGGDTLTPDHLDFGPGSVLVSGGTRADGGGNGVTELDAVLEMAERDHVQRVLASTGGHKSRSADLLRISRGRLDRLIEKHGLVVNV